MASQIFNPIPSKPLFAPSTILDSADELVGVDKNVAFRGLTAFVPKTGKLYILTDENNPGSFDSWSEVRSSDSLPGAMKEEEDRGYLLD